MIYITVIILVILLIVYYSSLNNFNTSNELANYLLREFYHANNQHLYANIISFIGLSFVETAIGWKKYLFSVIFIWLMSGILLYGYHSLVPSKKVYTVGFSGVIYGLIVLNIFVTFKKLNGESLTTLTGLLVGIIPQFYSKNISVSGHICGIISGLLCSFIILPKHKALLDTKSSR